MGAVVVLTQSAEEEVGNLCDDCCRCLQVICIEGMLQMAQLGVNIAGLTVVYNQFDEYECKSDIIKPDLFLIIGSFISLGFMVFGYTFFLFGIKREYGRQSIRCDLKWPFIVIEILFGLFFVSWSIISFIMYANFSDDCRSS